MAPDPTKSIGSSALSDLETKWKDEKRLRRFTEGVLDSRQAELEAAEHENEELKQKVNSLEKELQEARKQLAEAQSQSKSKTKQLQDAKDQIFHLQPSKKEITDSEACEAYKALLGNIQRWADNRMKSLLEDFDANRLRARPPPIQATRFVSLLREPAKRCVNIDQSDEHHVMAVIMNYVWTAFFSRSFYCPLDESGDESTLMWIEELELSMSDLPRDALQCRDWRGSTLAALTNQHGFKLRRTKYLGAIAEDLAAILLIIAPRANFAELQNSIRRCIIDPAAALAHRLQVATNIYSLKWPARTAWSRLEVYECINIEADGAMLDLSGTDSASAARKKVSYMFDLAPGLFVERVDSGKKLAPKAIHRPRVLVHGGEEQIVQCPTVIRWLWDSSSGPQSNIREPFFRTSGPKRNYGQPPTMGRLA